jgi:hypothetical protein
LSKARHPERSERVPAKRVLLFAVVLSVAKDLLFVVQSERSERVRLFVIVSVQDDRGSWELYPTPPNLTSDN